MVDLNCKTKSKTLAASLATLAVLAALVGCGGGGEMDTPKTALSAAARERPSASALATPATPATPADAEAFFDWVEQQLPQHFPRGATTQSIVFQDRHYTLRHYAATGNYVGLLDGGVLQALGPFTNGALTSFGRVEPFLCQARPELCKRIAAPTSHVVLDAGGRQCEPVGAEPILAARRRLTDAGIAVARSDCGLARVGVPAVCGASDTRYWIFEVAAADVDKAVALGFGRPDGERPAQPDEAACAW